MTDNPIIKGQLVCVALNDAEQFDAMQTTFNEAPYKSAPTQPVLYFKPRNTWSTEGAEIPWATMDDQPAESMVVGASLVVVFGQECCRVNPEEALNYAAGYTLVHDFSLPETSYYRPDIKGKCLDGSAPIGATVVPATAIENLQALTVTTTVNGTVVNTMPLARTVRSVAELISTISHIMTLQPGDGIAVAFPGQRAVVKPGDKVTSEVADQLLLNNSLSQ